MLLEWNSSNRWSTGSWWVDAIDAGIASYFFLAVPSALLSRKAFSGDWTWAILQCLPQILSPLFWMRCFLEWIQAISVTLGHWGSNGLDSWIWVKLSWCRITLALQIHCHSIRVWWDPQSIVDTIWWFVSPASKIHIHQIAWGLPHQMSEITLPSRWIWWSKLKIFPAWGHTSNTHFLPYAWRSLYYRPERIEFQI